MSWKNPKNFKNEITSEIDVPISETEETKFSHLPTIEHRFGSATKHNLNSPIV